MLIFKSSYNTNKIDGSDVMENNNLEPKKFSLSKIICPLLGYYLISIISQLIYMSYKMPSVIRKFVQGNSDMVEIFGEDINNMSSMEVYELFFANLTDDIYIDFLYEAADYMLENIGVVTVLTGVMVLPFLFRLMRKDNKKFGTIDTGRYKYPLSSYIFIIIGSVSLCIGLNCLMMMSGLVEISESYEATADALYNMEIMLQVIGLGIIIPLAEEMLYRGVIYRRLQNVFNIKVGIVMSAIMFGMVHGNTVQIIYGFIAGLVFAWLYSEFNSLKVPVLAHCVMNLTSIFITGSGFLDSLLTDNMNMGVSAVIGMTLTSACYVLITNKRVEKLG